LQLPLAIKLAWIQVLVVVLSLAVVHPPLEVANGEE
jgi:hypothetical protein